MLDRLLAISRVRHRVSMLSGAFSVCALVLASGGGVAHADFPTLDSAIQLARKRSVVVADATAEIGVANAQMTGARVSMFGNPFVEAQIDYGFGRGPAQELQGLTYTYLPMEIAGQRGARIEEARRLLDWKTLGVADARSLAAGQVVSAYGQFVLSAARVALASAAEQTAREEAKYFAGRLAVNDTTIYEKSLADGEVARWVQWRAEAELKVTQARADLSQIIGVVAVDSPSEDVDLLPPRLRSSWDDAHIARAVDRSPVIARLQSERRYWEASIDRYATERMPPIVPEIIAGRGSQGEIRLGAGLVFTFPVARRFQGEIARGQSGVQTASTRLELSRNLIVTRLRAARDAVGSVKRAIDELDKTGMAAVEMAVSASLQAYKAGKIEMTRVLLARRDLATARARRLDLLEAGWRACADLTVLSGDLP